MMQKITSNKIGGNSPAEPEVMTWGRAAPVIGLSLVFDALNIGFTMFWFFGPALAAFYCTNKVTEVVGSLGGISAAACATGAIAIGSFSAPAMSVFGTMLAMGASLFGWMLIGLIMLMTNARIFKEQGSLWFGGSLVLNLIPFIGSLFVRTITTTEMYYKQIKKDAENLATHKKQKTSPPPPRNNNN